MKSSTMCSSEQQIGKRAKIDNYSHQVLLMFLTSMVWEAQVSGRDQTARVTLPPEQEVMTPG